jgi:hypothetical protein
MENDKSDVLNEDVSTSDSPAAPAVAAAGASPQITFRGNSYDLMSVVGVTVGGMTLLTCATCNMGFYCLPLVPIILGIIGLVAAKDSVDPERTKLLSWLSVGSGAVIIILIAAIFIIYFAFIFIMIAADSGGF